VAGTKKTSLILVSHGGDGAVDLHPLPLAKLPIKFYRFAEDTDLLAFKGEQEVTATLGDDQTLRIDHLDHLALLNSEDLISLRLYANNDAGNILWEWGFNRGLTVSYRLPHAQSYINSEMINGTMSYRVLGNLRLRYEYRLPPQAERMVYIWRIGNSDDPNQQGRFCTGWGAATTDCPATPQWQQVITERDYIDWEPPAWWNTPATANGLTLPVSLTAQYRLNGENIIEERRFNIVTRPFGPGTTDNPTKGSDVAMLEQVLWQLGISPQKGSPGSLGARINSERGLNSRGIDLGHTRTCTGETADERAVFYPYRNNCIDGRVTTEYMVKRFQARNNNNNGFVSPEEIDAQSGHLIYEQDGNVNVDTLNWLVRDWRLYTAAYQGRRRPIIQRSDTEFDDWLIRATQIWQNGHILPSGADSHVPASYTDAVHRRVIEAAGLTWNDADEPDDPYSRKRLLNAWISEETPYHWGTNLSKKVLNTQTRIPYQPTPYRMMEGGDEHGSLSFSQLVYPRRFGERSYCEAHNASKMNIYDPEDQVKTFVIHTAADAAGTAAHNCPGGMNRAFVANALGTDYELTARADGDDIHDLVGIRGKDNLGTTEDDYEKLAKAIFFYNTQTWIAGGNRHSWPYLLRHELYSATSVENDVDEHICHTCKYTIKVRRNFFGDAHLRTYIWRGDQTAGGQDWCFGYGESEWVSGRTFTQTYEAARGDSLSVPPVAPVGRLNCTTGAPMP
jgi:hypothetical protein